MADKVTEIEIRLKATADTTANLKSLDKQLTTTLEKVERLQNAQNRGSVLKPKKLDGESQRELNHELKILAVLKQQKAELESIQRLRQQDTRTLAQFADRNYGKVGGSPQFVTPSSAASFTSLRAMRVLASTTTGDVGNDPYVAQAREVATKHRAGFGKRIRAAELKEEQDANAHVQQVLQLRKDTKRKEEEANRLLSSMSRVTVGGGASLGQSILGQPIVINPLSAGTNAAGNIVSPTQRYNQWQAQQVAQQKKQANTQASQQAKADKENEAEFKRLDRQRRQQWQAEKTKNEHRARMENKLNVHSAAIDDILDRRAKKGWIGLFRKPTYTEDEKYALNYAMGEVRVATQRLERPDQYLKYAPLVDRALGRGYAGSAHGMRQAGGFFHEAIKSAANVAGRAGFPLYAASAAGVGYAGYKGVTDSLHAAGEVESQKLFLQGLYNTFNQFTVGGKVQSPVQNFLLSGAKADTLYKDVREMAVKSPLTTQELFKAYAIGYPFLAKKGVTADQAVGIVDNVASIGKLLGLRPESFQDDLRALSSGNYRNVQSFQAVGVSRAQFGKLAKMEGSELVGELTKVFAPFNQAIQQYDQTYVGKMSRLQDAMFRLAATFGDKLADPMKQNLDQITASIEQLSSTGALDRLAEIFNRIVKMVTEFIHLVANNPDTTETVIKTALGAKAIGMLGGSGLLPALGGALKTPLVTGGATLGAYALPIAAAGAGFYSAYNTAFNEDTHRTLLGTLGDKIRNVFTNRRVADEPYHQAINGQLLDRVLSPANMAMYKNTPVSQAIAYTSISKMLSAGTLGSAMTTAGYLSSIRNSTGSEYDHNTSYQEFMRQGSFATKAVLDKYATPERMLRYLRSDKSLFTMRGTAQSLMDADGNISADMTADDYRKRAKAYYDQIYPQKAIGLGAKGGPAYVSTIPDAVLSEIDKVAKAISDGTMKKKITDGMASLVNPFLQQFKAAIKEIPQTITNLSVTRLAPLINDSSGLYGASAKLKGSVSDIDFELQSASERYSAAIAVNDYATAGKELARMKELGAGKFANLSSLGRIESQIGRNSIITSQGDSILTVTLDNGQTRVYPGMSKDKYLKGLGLNSSALAGISLATAHPDGKNLDTRLLTAMAANGMVPQESFGFGAITKENVAPLTLKRSELNKAVPGSKFSNSTAVAGGYSIASLQDAQSRVDQMDARLDKQLTGYGLDQTQRTALVLAAMKYPDLATQIEVGGLTDATSLFAQPRVGKIYSKVKTSNSLKFEMSGVEMLQDQRNDANFARNLANQQAQQAAQAYLQQADLRLQKKAFNKDILNKSFDMFTSQSVYGLDMRILGQGNILTSLSGMDNIPVVERQRLNASQEQRRLDFIKNLLPAHLKNLQPTGSKLERLRNQAIANITARPEYGSLLGTFGAEDSAFLKSSARYRGTMSRLYASNSLNIREALMGQTADAFFDTPQSKTARIEAVGQLALDKLAMQDRQLFEGQYTRAQIATRVATGTATPEQLSYLLGFGERDAQRTTIRGNMARDIAQVSRDASNTSYMRGYGIFKAGLGGYKGGEFAKYALNISEAEALLSGSASLGQIENADILALGLKANTDGSLTGAARSELEKFVEAMTKANTVLESNVRLEQDRLNRSSAVARQYGIAGTLPTLYEYRQNQDQFALDAYLVGTENDPVERARKTAEFYKNNGARMRRDRQQELFAGAGEAGFRALMGRGDVIGAITGALGTPALDEALSILRASDADIMKTMKPGMTVGGSRNAAALTAGSMFGAGMLVNALTPGNSYGAEGAQIGGAVGPALLAGLGPWGAAVGMLGGGLLGGLFKKKNTEEDRKRKEWQDRVAQLLSSIDKSLRPAPDYFRSYKKEQVMGSASKYLSGRVYNGLNVQLAAGR